MVLMRRHQFNDIMCKYRHLRRVHRMDLRAIVDHLMQCPTVVAVVTNKTDGNTDDNWTQSVIYSLISYEFKSEIKSLIAKLDMNGFIEDYAISDHHSRPNVMDWCDDNQMSYAIVGQHMLQHHNNYNKNICKSLSSNTSLINDGRLAFDVMICNINDIVFGNHSNHMTNNTGIVFESEVSHHLDRHGISYMSECQLRTNSFDVTPDFKLNLPLIVKICKRNDSDIWLIKTNDYFDHKFNQLVEASDEWDYEYVVINWIECKSMLASELCHSKYYRNQYSSYINRFGNGLVLYKYGFVSHIKQQFKNNIIVSHRLPPVIDPNHLSQALCKAN